MADPTQRGEVIVGIDGSEGSKVALEWALARQDVLGPVRTVGVYSLSFPVATEAMMPPHRYDPLVQLRGARDRVESILNATDPSLIANNTMIDGSSGRCLVEASKDAALLVVGCRGRSAAKEMLLGSVGSYCIKHAACPVAIIPDDADSSGSLGRLVVGVDGSDNSKAALEWALDHVDPEGKVVAISALSPMLQAYEIYVPPREELVEATRRHLSETVNAVATPAETSDLIEIEVRIGDPRNELRAAVQDADALVVGARGHRGVAYLILGSVATSLSHQPAGVTIVVPDR